MNVLFAADDAYPGFGGIAASTEGHAEALARRGHAVRVLTGRDPRARPPSDGVVVERLAALRLGALQTRLVVPEPRALQRALRWADVVHVNAPSPFGVLLIGMAKARGIPTVMGVHVQVETAVSQLSVAGPLVGPLMRTWYGLAFSLPAARVAPTDFAARMTFAWTGRPVHVVSNGLPTLPEAPPRRDARRLVASRWGPLDEGPLLVYLGRLSAEKRPGDLLDVASSLPPGVTLLIAGTGPMASGLEKRIRERHLTSRVRLVGFVEDVDVPTLLTAADLFLMPSPTELQSIASLEAMAYGCPVAAADHATSAVPEWVAASGAGIVYPPDDPARTGSMIRSLLADAPRLEATRSAARAYASQHHVDRAAERLEAIYTGYLRGEPPAPTIPR